MTRIWYIETGESMELLAKGHAETTEDGRESMVCAGISALTQTLMESVMRETEEGWIRAEGDMPGRGELWIRAWPGEEHWERIRDRFRFVMTGLEEIRKAYPGKIEIEEVIMNGDL